MKYFFVPGRKWSLSLAELTSVISQRDINNVELLKSEDLMIFDLQIELNEAMELFNDLGGFVKFGHVVGDPYTFLHEFFLKSERNKEEKVNFSLSFYPDKNSKNRVEEGSLMKLGMELKKWLRENSFKSRFVSKPHSLVTSPVLMNTNKVLESGFELNQFTHPKKNTKLWGVTLSVQDYEGFSTRDYDRPRSNKKKGMIPPKLARIMVNLAQLPKGSTIWDPFCGSGTIPMEAMMLGYNVLASDIDETSIEETKENLKWLSDSNWISHCKHIVFQHDIADGMPQNLSFDAIVTETFLGPVLRKEISVNEIEEIMKSRKPLFDALEEIAKQATVKRKQKKIILVVPSFKSHQGWVEMNTSFKSDSNIKDITSEVATFPLHWDRPNSIIRRNIKIFAF